jgi:hypothetical protein
MSREIAIRDLLFDVNEVPVEAVLGRGKDVRRISVPGKKALINELTGQVLGVVGRDYRVVTNREAIEFAREVCGKAFPGLDAIEWEAKRAAAPRTLSYSFIDLMHRTHVLNYLGEEKNGTEPFTPFLRVTNSFNGARALRFDIGFLRKHCSNGVIFEEEVATITAAHNAEALAKLKIEISARSLDQLWQEFSSFIALVRGVEMSEPLSLRALENVLHLPTLGDGDTQARRAGIDALLTDTSSRLTGYRQTLGENAYAVFNTLTDIAARPPESRYFQKDRDTLEKRAGRWLKQLVQAKKLANFDIEKFTSGWSNGTSKPREFSRD